MSAGDLKICGGKYAGHQLRSPNRQIVRPMRSRVRGAVFDQLEDDLPGTRFLDCFAGTGAMGIEALSRGARAATFLDVSEKVLSYIRKNIQSVLETDRAVVHQCDVLEQRPIPGVHDQFETISVTPPYPFYEQPEMRRKLFRLFDHLAEFLSEERGQMIVECEDHTRFGQPPSGLKRVDRKSFGTTVIHRFRNQS